MWFNITLNNIYITTEYANILKLDENIIIVTK